MENTLWKSKPVIRDVVLNPLLISLVVGVPPLGLVILIWIVVRRKTTAYKLTNQRLIFESGVISSSSDDIELHRIRETKVKQGAYDRFFGIGTIEINAMDSGDPVQMRKIAKPREVRDKIRAAAEELHQSRMLRIQPE